MRAVFVLGVIAVVMALVPGAIGSKRRAVARKRIGWLSVGAFVAAGGIGFLGLLGPWDYAYAPVGMVVISAGILVGGALWVAALIWACMGERVDSRRGFDVMPLAQDHPGKNQT
ncbi:MAG TPA: hypothetical protein VGQ99_09605 [Tepidisphaeraceae bacterium]|nr:hypothetical protein [Tepidisphaeraceae bacterium]